MLRSLKPGTGLHIAYSILRSYDLHFFFDWA